MAVQKNRSSKSKRNMRRAHDGLNSSTLATDQETGEVHRRHHITLDGFYRGREVVSKAAANDDSNDES